MKDKFYAYILLDPTNSQPFYVGKGCGTRMYHHWRQRRSSKNCNKMLAARLRKIDELGLEPIYEKVLINTSSKQALAKEQELIKSYGRLDIKTGILCNLTDGGENGSSSWSPQMRERKRQIELAKRKGRPVSQYTLDGEYVQTFPSAKVASETIFKANRSYITQCCKGKRKSAGKYLWTYANDQPPKFNKKYYKQVNQYDINNNYLATYRSLTEAAKIVSVSVCNIARACRGTIKTSGGYIWRYVNS